MEALIVVSFIIEERGRVLLVREEKNEIKGTWSFPGGRLEQGETILDARERELYEETGMTLQSAQLVRIYEGVRDGIEGVRLVFKTKAQKVTDNLADDVGELKWVTRAQLKEMYNSSQIRNGIFHRAEVADYLNGLFGNQVEIIKLIPNSHTPEHGS